MKSILVDAGPLIALFDSSDQYHKKSLQFIKDFQGELWTTWPVITEVCYMLNFNKEVQLNFLKWIERGGLKLFEFSDSNIFRFTELMEKFSDVPMDLADASLIVVSEIMNYKEIASIDSDFYVYRDIRNQYLTNIFK